MQQGQPVFIRSLGERVILATWFVWSFVVISAYSANLAAYFTTTQIKPPIRSTEDLLQADYMQFGFMRNKVGTRTFFAKSNSDAVRRMYKLMLFKDTFVNDNSEGLARVREGGFAFITDGATAQYALTKKPCDITVMEEVLDRQYVAMAVQNGSGLRHVLNSAIIQLGESGALQKMEQYWFTEHGDECKDERDHRDQSSDNSSLGMEHLSGIFFILAGGLLVALLVSAVGRRWRRHSEDNGDEVSIQSDDEPSGGVE